MTTCLSQLFSLLIVFDASCLTEFLTHSLASWVGQRAGVQFSLFLPPLCWHHRQVACPSLWMLGIWTWVFTFEQHAVSWTISLNWGLSFDKNFGGQKRSPEQRPWNTQHSRFHFLPWAHLNKMNTSAWRKIILPWKIR